MITGGTGSFGNAVGFLVGRRGLDAIGRVQADAGQGQAQVRHAGQAHALGDTFGFRARNAFAGGFRMTE